jgi:hypothetical protein
VDLDYNRIEQQLIQALPELRPAAEYYWSKEGIPGENCGPYIFFDDLFACYVEILLAMPDSPRRQELLRRAFAFVELMLARNGHVADLAFVGLYEGRPAWWFARARDFIGSQAADMLDRAEWRWRQWTTSENYEIVPEIIDLYGVRDVIASELKEEGVTLVGVPGTTHKE